MNSNRQKPPTPWPLVVLFFVISICVIVVGIFYYYNQKKTLLEEKQQELSAISDLKIRQITQWRLDRLGNAIFLGENTLLVKRISKFLNTTSKKSLNDNVLQSLKSLTENFDYKNVLLLDTTGNVRLSYPDQDTLIGDHLKPLLPGIINKRKVVLTDLHRTSLVSYVHLDLIVPLIDHSTNDTLVLGVLALRIDPQKVLYPLIQLWPTPSESAESLLIRREGEEIVYLNELRHIKNDELLFRKPLANEKLAASMAIQGIDATVDAIDYRGVHVVAAMKKIPGTSWFMVAKIDREEILSALNEQTTMAVIILILFILTSGLFLGFLLRNQRVRFYREKYENELDRLALVKHFDYILKFANDIILLIDKDLKIIEANDRALEVYMYTRDEFIGMELEKIRAPESLAQFQEQLKNINDNESATFETFHKRKDDSVFPIEISSRARYYRKERC
jgi:PAS domain S-box-containing protein